MHKKEEISLSLDKDVAEKNGTVKRRKRKFRSWRTIVALRFVDIKPEAFQTGAAVLRGDKET